MRTEWEPEQVSAAEPEHDRRPARLPGPTMDEFRLKIELGNAAMQTAEQVAGALRGVADYIDSATGSDFEHIDAGMIRDVNGNTVGEWNAL